tara:strand:+ start:774 stop:1049 length:276 start_codon:yes stop_codon:yes gene_type:complete
MANKIENLEDLKYYSNMLLLTGTVKKWRDMKPNNKEIQKISKALIEVTLYVIRLQDDKLNYQTAFSDERYAKNKALLELKELTEKYQAHEI